MKHLNACLLSAALTAPVLAQDQPDAQPPLPVTQVVLYTSGVGYFEHAGDVSGTRTVRLTFDEKQMDDVLKSMVVMDLGGGQIEGVSYPSREPLSRALQSFAVDLSGNPSLPDLLNGLRGQR